MKVKEMVLILLAVGFGVACEDDSPEIIESKNEVFEFNSGAEGWTEGFADYPSGEEELYELSFAHSTLVAPLDETQGALKQSGNNHSDDLFMFVKKKISGLTPNDFYTVDYEIELASNVENGSLGVGGSPGSSVYIKAGLSSVEPLAVKQDDGYFRMNIDKNNQANSGDDMKVLGNFENGTDANEYALKTLSYSDEELEAKANENGELWIIVGTDSGFESTTTIYYNTISVVLKNSTVSAQ